MCNLFNKKRVYYLPLSDNKEKETSIQIVKRHFQHRWALIPLNNTEEKISAYLTAEGVCMCVCVSA